MEGVISVINAPGAVEALRQLDASSETAYVRRHIEDIFTAAGADTPSQLVDGMLSHNLLGRIGSRIGISAYGRRALLLVEALDGADIDETFRRLRRLDGHRGQYELVRQRMTAQFFQTFVDRPSFGRLYVCSPWINPTPREAALLRHAALQSEKRAGAPPVVLVVTRPPSEQPEEATIGLQPFIDVGASIYFHPRVHSKLYIREPDAQGGVPIAVVGSQNLTRSNMLELGIRVNGDSQLILQLTRYFYDLVSWSTERN